MINRRFVCIILFCLPKAENLDSQQLVSISTGLVSWILILEVWGMSNPHESFFDKAHARRYTATSNVSKKDLETVVENGRVINLSDMSDQSERVRKPSQAC